jgi:Fe2+ or Zn2+ uptake regulation protein
MRRKSVQRERIFDCVRRNASHPTAQDVFEALKPKMPSLSVGNTYRNLKILAEEGRIVVHRFGGGMERYDAVTGAHYHFLCRTCGRVSDFAIPFQEHVVKEAQKHTKQKILGHTIQFTGVCAACAARTPKTRKGDLKT